LSKGGVSKDAAQQIQHPGEYFAVIFREESAAAATNEGR